MLQRTAVIIAICLFLVGCGSSGSSQGQQTQEALQQALAASQQTQEALQKTLTAPTATIPPTATVPLTAVSPTATIPPTAVPPTALPRDRYLATLEKLNKDGEEIKQIAFTPELGWIILFGRNGWESEGLPPETLNALDQINDRGEEIKQIAFSPDTDRSWVIVYVTDKGEEKVWQNGLLATMVDDINKVDLQTSIRITFTNNNGWIILYGRNGWYSQGVSEEVLGDMDKIHAEVREIKYVNFGRGDAYIILYDRSSYIVKGTQDLLDKLKQISDSGENLKQVVFTPDSGWIIIYGRNGLAWNQSIPRQ